MTKNTTPGLRRLRANPAAETIRSDVLADQRRARAEAKARIKAAAESAPPEAHSTPQTAEAGAEAPKGRRKAKAAPAARKRAGYAPSPIPEPATKMAGMNKANAERYLAAARGEDPFVPDFSKPSYEPDRARLETLQAIYAAGDIDGLKAFGIRVYYTAALELDRFRHRCVLALEARSRVGAN
jgi:hypothetical protein